MTRGSRLVKAVARGSSQEQMSPIVWRSPHAVLVVRAFWSGGWTVCTGICRADAIPATIREKAAIASSRVVLYTMVNGFIVTSDRETWQVQEDPEETCACFDPQARYTLFTRTEVGIDKTSGRYGEVYLYRCTQCGALWLHYLVEYEAFTAPGRWYRGLIAPEIARTVTPENAVAILESLSWHFYGGSYFQTSGKRGSGPIFVDM